MDICIGSTTESKNEGIKRGLLKIPYFNGASYHPFDAPSGVREQPWGVEEIYTGAVNRAVAAFESGKYKFGIGLESGVDLISTHKPREGIGIFLNRTACVIYDGKVAYPGESRAFALPHRVFDRMIGAREAQGRPLTLHEGLVLERLVEAKSGKGMIHRLSNGEIDRSKLIEEAAYTAGMLLMHTDLDYSFP